MLRVADGPDEVHKMVIARRELNRAAKRAEGSADAAGNGSAEAPVAAAPGPRGMRLTRSERRFGEQLDLAGVGVCREDDQLVRPGLPRTPRCRP